jgi:hypothetical protein
MAAQEIVVRFDRVDSFGLILELVDRVAIAER